MAGYTTAGGEVKDVSSFRLQPDSTHQLPRNPWLVKPSRNGREWAIKETDRRCSPRTSLTLPVLPSLLSSPSHAIILRLILCILHFPLTTTTLLHTNHFSTHSYAYYHPSTPRKPATTLVTSTTLETSISPPKRLPAFLACVFVPRLHFTTHPAEGYTLAPVGLWSASAQQPSRY